MDGINGFKNNLWWKDGNLYFKCCCWHWPIGLWSWPRTKNGMNQDWFILSTKWSKSIDRWLGWRSHDSSTRLALRANVQWWGLEAMVPSLTCPVRRWFSLWVVVVRNLLSAPSSLRVSLSLTFFTLALPIPDCYRDHFRGSTSISSAGGWRGFNNTAWSGDLQCVVWRCEWIQRRICAEGWSGPGWLVALGKTLSPESTSGN